MCSWVNRGLGSCSGMPDHTTLSRSLRKGRDCQSCSGDQEIGQRTGACCLSGSGIESHGGRLGGGDGLATAISCSRCVGVGPSGRSGLGILGECHKCQGKSKDASDFGVHRSGYWDT